MSSIEIKGPFITASTIHRTDAAMQAAVRIMAEVLPNWSYKPGEPLSYGSVWYCEIPEGAAEIYVQAGEQAVRAFLNDQDAMAKYLQQRWRIYR